MRKAWPIKDSAFLAADNHCRCPAGRCKSKKGDAAKVYCGGKSGYLFSIRYSGADNTECSNFRSSMRFVMEPGKNVDSPIM